MNDGVENDPRPQPVDVKAYIKAEHRYQLAKAFTAAAINNPNMRGTDDATKLVDTAIILADYLLERLETK